MEKLKSFIDGKEFQNAILAVIIMNSLVLGLQTVPELNDGVIGTVLDVIDTICLGVFIIEMLLKMIAYKFIGYFRSGWNWFDFIIIITSVASGLAVLSSMRILRVFRVFRSLKGLRGFKMISSLKPLQVIIGAIGKSIPGLSWTALLLLIIYYIFAIIGITQFGAAFPEWFGDIPKAMFTLFQVMTLESWSMGICRPVMEEFSYAWAYFVPFVLTSSFVMMNVVVGVVVNAISEVAEYSRKPEKKSDTDEETENDVSAEDTSAEDTSAEDIRAEITAVREHLARLEDLLAKQDK
ncbi:MAG: ion transporter [Ruminiclostridium sp.]|nr:ion transporter [Ruminiclostridium sp.]